jgi:hypothetical protein
MTVLNYIYLSMSCCYFVLALQSGRSHHLAQLVHAVAQGKAEVAAAVYGECSAVDKYCHNVVTVSVLILLVVLYAEAVEVWVLQQV